MRADLRDRAENDPYYVHTNLILRKLYGETVSSGFLQLTGKLFRRC